MEEQSFDLLQKKDPLQFPFQWPVEANSLVNLPPSQEGTSPHCDTAHVPDFSFPEFFLKSLLFLLLGGMGISLAIKLKPSTTSQSLSQHLWNVLSSFAHHIQNGPSDLLLRSQTYFWPTTANGWIFQHSNSLFGYADFNDHAPSYTTSPMPTPTCTNPWQFISTFIAIFGWRLVDE